ncbi:MAG: TonB-dependent receptor plug domain-containing protein [Lewinellaceae bacterium]|nr:TonB-dependent receptor plug domain-containing protein [Lewinellaceae bacterium]
MKIFLWAIVLALTACSSPRGAQNGTPSARSDRDSTSTDISEKAEYNPDKVSSREVPQALNLRDYLARVPGVMVDGYNVSIRGGGPPLFVIDGVQAGRSLAQAESLVSVHDIDYVEVLKSPTDLAMYGRLGGNGVIRIFTKKGE